MDDLDFLMVSAFVALWPWFLFLVVYPIAHWLVHRGN